jgi:multidrug resistance efflux pump
VKAEWKKNEEDRSSMRQALSQARTQLNTLSRQNQRLTGLLTEVSKEQAKLTQAKGALNQALGMQETLNLSAALEAQADRQG